LEGTYGRRKYFQLIPDCFAMYALKTNSDYLSLLFKADVFSRLIRMRVWSSGLSKSISLHRFLETIRGYAHTSASADSYLPGSSHGLFPNLEARCGSTLKPLGSQFRDDKLSAAVYSLPRHVHRFCGNCWKSASSSQFVAPFELFSLKSLIIHSRSQEQQLLRSDPTT
jgi:hypothetical protein